MAQYLVLALGVASGMIASCSQLCLLGGPINAAAARGHRVRVDKFIEQDRVFTQEIGRPRALCGEPRDAFEHVRVLGQQCKVGFAFVDGFDEIEQAKKCSL